MVINLLDKIIRVLNNLGMLVLKVIGEKGVF